MSHRHLLALLAALASLVLAAPSAAKPIKKFSVKTTANSSPGVAHAYGTIHFFAKRKVRITGRINDICPADGYGAYVTFYVNYGQYSNVYRKRKDTSGCENSGKAYDFIVRAPSKVVSVRVSVSEYDADRGVTIDRASKLIFR